MTEARVVAFGDAAVLIELGPNADDSSNRRALALAAAILTDTRDDQGYGRPVPGLDSVLVPVDPLQPGVEAAVRRLDELARAASKLDATDVADGPLVEVAVRYGGPDGPDLDDVAARVGLRANEVVDLHAGTVYRVLFLGFTPGFAYLGDLPERLGLPRLATPRTRVPAGSVAIAGRQTAVYPFSTPGGWRLIGRTDLDIWDATRDRPAALLPGMRVRFVPIGPSR
jgi:KipI family sensor histidine kinase inhibitor